MSLGTCFQREHISLEQQVYCPGGSNHFRLDEPGVHLCYDTQFASMGLYMGEAAEQLKTVFHLKRGKIFARNKRRPRIAAVASIRVNHVIMSKIAKQCSDYR